MTRVTIGIQARSGSKRFPNKIEKLIGHKTMLHHVMESCFKSAIYLNNWNSKKIVVEVVLLVPYGDPIISQTSKEITIVEGPEDDVLSRYLVLMKKSPVDYLCRITADCPMVPHFMISKLITLAVMNEYDYVSNVDEQCRTVPDGYDCEVISRRGMDFLDKAATNKEDREHVTTYMRSNPPLWANLGTIVGHLDQSHIKISADTEEDFKRIESEIDKVEKKRSKAISRFGKRQVHSF